MRRGYKTTEFWATVALTVGLVVQEVSDTKLFPGRVGEIVAGVAVAAFAVSRGLAKASKG